MALTTVTAGSYPPSLDAILSWKAAGDPLRLVTTDATGAGTLVALDCNVAKPATLQTSGRPWSVHFASLTPANGDLVLTTLSDSFSTADGPSQTYLNVCRRHAAGDWVRTSIVIDSNSDFSTSPTVTADGSWVQLGSLNSGATTSLLRIDVSSAGDAKVSTLSTLPSQGPFETVSATALATGYAAILAGPSVQTPGTSPAPITFVLNDGTHSTVTTLTPTFSCAALGPVQILSSGVVTAFCEEQQDFNHRVHVVSSDGRGGAFTMDFIDLTRIVTYQAKPAVLAYGNSSATVILATSDGFTPIVVTPTATDSRAGAYAIGNYCGSTSSTTSLVCTMSPLTQTYTKPFIWADLNGTQTLYFPEEFIEASVVH